MDEIQGADKAKQVVEDAIQVGGRRWHGFKGPSVFLFRRHWRCHQVGSLDMRTLFPCMPTCVFCCCADVCGSVRVPSKESDKAQSYVRQW